MNETFVFLVIPFLSAIILGCVVYGLTEAQYGWWAIGFGLGASASIYVGIWTLFYMGIVDRIDSWWHNLKRGMLR